MYESCFPFHRRPFSAAPDAQAFVAVGPLVAAQTTIGRCIERGSGPTMIIGAAGTGKTLLCQLIADAMGQRLEVAQLSGGQLCTRRDLLQAVLYELGLPYRDMQEGELRLSLMDHLAPSPRCPNGLLLVVDEANHLPLELLEELRMITNLVRDGQSRVQLVLAGSTSLEEQFTDPKLESFNQRVAARCYLGPLNREETARYIAGQIECAGANAKNIFSPDSLSAIFDATDGIPRLINQVCDRALVLAAEGRQNKITAAIVQEAWADLQQLPAPWLETNSTQRPPAASEIIEFGSLDEPESEPPSIPPAPLPETRPQEVATNHNPQSAASEQSAASKEWIGPEQWIDPELSFQLEQIERQLEEAARIAEQAVEENQLVASRAPESAARPAAAAAADASVIDPSSDTDPFSEMFDEEEVVLDTYASLQDGRTAGLVHTDSLDAQQIVQMIRLAESSNCPEPQAESGCQNAIVESEGGLETTDDEPLAPAAEPGEQPLFAPAEQDAGAIEMSELTQAVANHLSETSDAHEPAAPRRFLVIDGCEDAQPEAEPANEAANEFPVEQDEEEAEPNIGTPREIPHDDRDLILVQDDAEIPANELLPHGQARRQKYRQLFSQLRGERDV